VRLRGWLVWRRIIRVLIRVHVGVLAGPLVSIV
jgi:hypothetical protein